MSEENQSIPGVPVGLKIKRIGYPFKGDTSISPLLCGGITVWKGNGGGYQDTVILALDNDYLAWNLADIPLPEWWGYAGGSVEAAFRIPKPGEHFLSTASPVIVYVESWETGLHKRIILTPLAKTLTITVTGPPDNVSMFRRSMEIFYRDRSLTMEIK
jgi:hypothetical protein